MRGLLLLALLLIAPPAALAQVPPSSCTLCETTGKLPCPKHRAAECALEEDVGEKLRNRVPTGDAVQDVYGTNLLALEEAWKAWVLETYPVK